MTPTDLEKAREITLKFANLGSLEWLEENIASALTAAREAENEACAELVQKHWYNPDVTATGMAAAIRARRGK